MDYKNIINDIGKYHYLIVNTSKSIILSSSNSKNEARIVAIQKMKPIVDKLLGKTIYLLTLRKILTKDLKNQENDTIKVIGGPIEVTIEKVQVLNENKLKNLGGFNNNRVYFSEKYFYENKSIDDNQIKEIAYDYYNEKLKNGPFDLNIIN
jgi:hypothetical protein